MVDAAEKKSIFFIPSFRYRIKSGMTDPESSEFNAFARI